MSSRIFRALLLLALLACGSAFAAVPAVTGWKSPRTNLTGPTVAGVCAASAAAQSTASALYNWTFNSVTSTVVCQYVFKPKAHPEYTGTGDAETLTSITNACPANSTSSGPSLCTCNSGFSENSAHTACEVTKSDNETHCESMGAGGFTRGMTGKTGGSVPSTTCFLTDPPFPSEPGKGCAMTVGDSVIVPQADGSRLFSAVGKYTGATCTPAVDPVLGDPRPTKEDKCPGGFEGVVNGLSKCIASEPDKGVEGVKNTVKTNADGSTTAIKEQTKCTGEQCTTTRTETITPSGGGTPTINISGITQSLADKCATDKTNPVCTKTGTTDPTQTTNGNGTGDEEGMECGIAGKPACNVKVDETGVPSNVGTAFDSAKTDLDTNKTAAEAQIAAAASIQAPSWSFSFQFPTGCTSYSVATFKGVAFQMNPCAYQSTIHDLMSMVWAAVTAFCLIGMVGRTIREA